METKEQTKKTTKIPFGEYDYQDGEANKYGVKDFMIGTPSDEQMISVWRDNDDRAYDQAVELSELIVDTLNTYQENLLLPSELLKQRDELLEALSAFIDFPAEDLQSWIDYGQPVTITVIPKDLENALFAVSKALNQ